MDSKKFYLLEKRAGSNKVKNNKNKIILNTTVGIARNLINRKFVSVSSSQEKNILLEEMRKCISDIKELEDFHFYKVKDLKGIQRDLFFKDYMLDPEIAYKVQGKGLFVKTGLFCGESSAIIINHEDHIRVQSVCKLKKN